MKLRFLLPSVIFLFSGLISRGQVTEMLYQGFESSETEMFTVTPSTSKSYSTTYHMSGSRSLELQQSTTEDVTMLLTELDFTQNTSLRYITLEFDHLCTVDDQGSLPVCRILYKRANETESQWHSVTSRYYDMTDGGSPTFNTFGSFSKSSYTTWGTTLSNEEWKSERFKLDDVITAALATSERRLMIKFVVRQSANSTTGKWLLDNLRIRASASPMTAPIVKMVSYPDGYYYPSSRGARIIVNPTTTVAAGINPDSVYMYYRVGVNGSPVRVQMTSIGSGRYAGDIPFFGYDTLMSFYCVARDATSNANMATFPKAANSWVEYICIRGVEQNGITTSGFEGSNTSVSGSFPFGYQADGRSEWVYDSALLAAAGYGPGEIVAMKFTLSGHTNAVTRPRLQVRMKNVPTSYTVDVSNPDDIPFTSTYMKVVYDSALAIQESNANGTQTMTFQDTFFYAGKDLLVQVVYDDTEDKTATPIKMIAAPATKKSIYIIYSDAFQGYTPFSSSDVMTSAEASTAYRPALVLTQKANLPLLYDMGVSALVAPSYDVPMTTNDHSVTVKLKNFGALPVQGIRISYSIDESINGYYDWTGTLNGGADQDVTIATSIPLAAGFHTLRAWVEDTLTAVGQNYRDHEPYNDTSFSSFVVCDGPMSGVRRIGGTNADFNTMEEFLYSLGRCGIGDSLVVKLAPGNYDPFTVPAFTRASQDAYLVFEPASGNVIFYSSTANNLESFDSLTYEYQVRNNSIANLEETSNVRFRNLSFVRYSLPLTDMVTMGIGSSNCHFEGCSFIDSMANPAASVRINAMINTGYANNMVVDGCTFVGGKVGVLVQGQAADIQSSNNTVRNSIFRNQYENAVSVSSQANAEIDGNEMYDVLSNTMGVLLLSDCSGETRVTRNKIYTSHGAGGIGLNNVTGTATLHALVANNMIVCADDGTANLLRSPLNVMSAAWLDVVYNSVKMTATQRNNTAAATFGGGGTSVQASRFVNNVVVTLDETNYALNYMPGTITSNEVGHNVYYTLGSVLNRKSGSSSQTLSDWVLAVPEDTASVEVNPNFLNGSLVDLRTFNRLVKGVGIPIATVPLDMFDTVRSLTATCPGAFEFVSLMYDFEPEALVSPLSEDCHMPNQVPLSVLVRNSGTQYYNGTGMSIGYQVNTGAMHTVAVTDSIPAEDTVTIVTGATLHLPANGTLDSVYTLRVWTIYASDPNQTNDTTTFLVTSKYHPARPADDSVQIAYATATTLTPTTGVEQWSVYNNTAAPLQSSEIYWYRDTTDAAPILVGSTLTTDTLRVDTTFYFRQKRNKPIVRITQLEFAHANNTTGLTASMPYWISSGRKVALQLTNVGDAPACLYGDSIVTVSPSSSLNNKIYVFTDSIYIQPGAALVVQYANGTSANPAMTVHTGSSFTVNASSNIAFLYKHQGVLEDAVVMNAVPSHGAPSYIWMGSSGVNVSSSASTAGLVRTAFNGQVSDWRVATNSNRMFLNTIDPGWIRYEDNGCEGYFASYKVKMIAPPAADISLNVPVLPESRCGMGMESISVLVRNYGVQPVNGVVLNYCAGGDTVRETVDTIIGSNGSLFYTFAGQMNMAFDADSLVRVKVWADTVSGDYIQTNDTSVATVWVPFTPAAPDTLGVHVVSYANVDTTVLTPIEGLIPVWYDYDGNAVDTGYTNISEILYIGGERGVSYLVRDTSSAIVGTGIQMNTANAFPSPYQPKSKFAKQQYIYSASELKAGGLKAGPIDSVAFALKAFGNNVSSITFNEYNLSMGLTSDTIFATTTDWKSTRQVYSRSSFTLGMTDLDTWVTHPLDSPFYWDGESSIVVQVVHRIATAISQGARSAYTAKPNSVMSKDGASELSPTTEEYVGAGNRSPNRPNIRFNGTVFGCESAITPYTIEMVNIPPVDVTVLWPNRVDTLEYNSCNDIPIYVRVRNQGAADAEGVKLYYYFDTESVDSISVTSSIASGATLDTLLFSRHMAPGRHTVRVVVSAPGDNISTNDMIVRSFMVRFCNGSYTIATSGGDYGSFGEAIDTLNIVGVQGPVVFNVAPGTYNEQVVLNNIPGSSSENTIGFVGTGSDVLLTAATTQTANYVMLLDSSSYVTLSNFRIESRPATGNYANALVIQKGSHITVDSMRVKVKGSINNVSASCVVLMGGVSDLTFTNNVIDSGYYALRTGGALSEYSNLTITDNTFKNFLFQGVNLRGVTNIMLNSNEITTGVTMTGRGLTGIYLAQTEGSLSIQKNKIYLVDDKNGGKRGIQLENVSCVASNPALVANNMISCHGTGTAGLTPAKPSGIWIDSSSTYVNVYFNTVRVYCGTYNGLFSEASYSFFSGATVSHIQVMNNIFANLSKGYAYYVSELGTVSLSNYNAYYTESNRPFTWKNIITNLAGLQVANTDDANSVFDEPYFRADNDLHLMMTNFAGIAQYNADVPDDIDGNIRKQVPGPTIGAHEMVVYTHDMAVVRIIEPVMPASLNFNPPNNMPPHIESDSVRVIAKFFNNGMAPESNVQWYAYLEGHEADTRTPNISLGTFASGQSKIDTVMMPTILGITDTNSVHVVVVIPVDSNLSNNDMTSKMYLAPAFNLAATSMSTDHVGCNMDHTVVKITVKNAGYKDFPANTAFKIGYHPIITQPTNITVNTLPDTVEENTSLMNTLLMGQSTTIDFTQNANLYPTGNSVDMKVRLIGWVNYDLDITKTNDTTPKNASPINSFFSPEAPVGYDTVFDYATWGAVRASQVNNRPIKWYRDTLSTPFYQPTQYNASCLWSNTPQYFHDSIYYLMCHSSQGCASSFSQVHVYVNPPVQNDMAFEELLAPLGGRVYMENDTVRVQVVNYGTRSQSNVPISYRLQRKQGNVYNVIQEVSETIPATIASGQSYVYTFNQLLDIPTPTQAAEYKLTVWTDLVSDAVRRNDTIHSDHTFNSLPESTYNPQQPESPSFDITRVSFNEFDFECPQLGRGLTNLANYASPDYPVVHVTRGLSDSIIVQVTPLDGSAQADRVKIWVGIDFNRDGFFSPDEMVVNGDIFYDNTTYSNFISIPNSASFGYMRMRVAVGSYADFSSAEAALNNGSVPSNKNGHNIDALLFVDANPPALDLAVTQIVAPRSYLIRDDQPRTISFRIANKGTTGISNPEFYYRFDADDTDSATAGSVIYNGTLEPGTSAIVSLPSHVFPYGKTDLTIWHQLEGDSNAVNNQLQFQYNRFHIVQAIVKDNFDLEDLWYAPIGYNLYSYNFWQRGTPSKTRLNAAYSEPNAWVTDLSNAIATGTRGNVSYLYSPIMNIAQIRSDTLSFRLRRNLINGSSLRLEFYNYEGKWVTMNLDSLTNWYNNVDDECFDNTTAGNDYNYYWIPTNRLSGEFQERVQFRFVYTTPMSSSTSAAFGEGCAIDDFYVGRARRAVDAGVVGITYPTAPAYGQTIYPKVLVHNYGTDTLRSLKLGYIHYGTYLPKETVLSCNLAPMATDTFAFDASFIVASDFPDTFNITAFTLINSDIYRDNDSCTQSFPLSPLENDIDAHSFIYPLDRAVAGDSLKVTMRVRNFGTSPISTATASYIVNGQNRVDEEVDFIALMGHPLGSMDYFNYTFTQRFRAPMGVVQLTGIIKSPQNDYIYNDTITKRIECVNSILDIAAASVIVDSSSHTEVRISVVIENRGARGANGFEVGYYIDGDSSNIYREIYSRDLPLPALETGSYTFAHTLTPRSAGYTNVTGFVHAAGDNDNSNDTTSVLAQQYRDIEFLNLIVIENAQPDCRVFAVVRNNGNIPLQAAATLHFDVTINGQNIVANIHHFIAAGQTVSLEIDQHLPKSPVRSYVGSGTLTCSASDADLNNNQTSSIEIRGYWEDVPLVESSTLVLDQNYPNPAEGRTTIPFTLPNAADVRFFIIDAMGHIVNAFSRHYAAGAQTIDIDMSSYPSGVYYYGIEVDGQRRMKKMILR